ncbi:MAG: hypothetical protein R2789_18215 [Microthrixaceae bacterium]
MSGPSGARDHSVGDDRYGHTNGPDRGRGDQDPDDEPLEPWSAPDGGPPRQWTHPSEAGLQVRVQTDRRRGRRLALSLLAIGTGVLLGTALVATLLRSDETAASTETDRAPLHDCLAMVDVVSEGEELQVTGLLVDDGRHVLVVGEDLRGAERIAVRIGGSRTGAELVAMDPYADLSLLELHASAGSTPRSVTNPRWENPCGSCTSMMRARVTRVRQS